MKKIEIFGRYSVKITAGYILLSIGFPFFFFGGPGYHAERSFKTAWDLGHILFFFLATWLYLHHSGHHEGRRQSWPAIFRILFAVLCVGIVIELIQQVIDGRIGDCGDVYRDVLGSLAALSFAEMLPGSGRIRILVVCAVVGLLLFAVWPVYRSLNDELVARKQFPVLADFETPFEQTRFNDIRQVQREQRIVRHGRYALRVQLSTAHYSGISLFYFPHDWRGYKTMHFSVYNPGKDILPLHCRIHDSLHSRHGMRYDDRFHKLFDLQPGWNDCIVQLDDVRTAPKTRFMDMAHIENFAIFVVRQQRPRTIYLDYLLLD